MKRHALLFILMIGVLSGCGHQTSFVNRDADMGFYEVVAIAPFENLTGDATAAPAVARVFRTELWAKGYWQVVAEGDWIKAEREVRQEIGLDSQQPLSLDAIARIGEILGAQGVFFGTVRTYAMQRVGQDEYPLVALSFQFVDAPSGNVIWDISLSERGGPKFPFIGIGETHTLADLTAKLCARAVKDIAR